MDKHAQRNHMATSTAESESLPTSIEDRTGRALKFPVEKPDPRTVASQAAYVGRQNQAQLQQSFVDTLEGKSLPQVNAERWVLTPHERKVADQAQAFIAQRYRELGITTLPQTYGPFFYNDTFSRSSGLATAPERWFGIREPQPWEQNSDAWLAALMVHEHTHAVGAVRLTERALQTETPFLSGLRMSTRVGRQHQPIFTALEEYVACSNQRLVLESFGYDELDELSPVRYRVNPDSELDIAILRASIEIYDEPEVFAQLEEAQLLENGWHALAKRYGFKSVDTFLHLLIYEKRTEDAEKVTVDTIQDIYGATCVALDKLSFEIFPDLPRYEANRAFRDC
jgi:hypothetical protein